MMPMKNAPSDMKSAASPRKETARLRALATGLRLIMTAAPKTSISAEAVQKKKGDIIVRRGGLPFCHVERSETSPAISGCEPASKWSEVLLPRLRDQDDR